ncbi:8570_t:CDS:2, partial [Paraglomus brasilianum]
TNGENDDLLQLEFTNSQNRNGAFRTIVSLLHTLVPFLVSCDPPVLKNGDTLKLRFSGDGRQVGRSQSHVLMTMCVLNEGEAVLTPNKQYTICLYIGKESYQSLQTVAKLFTSELNELQNNGFTDEQGNT